MLASVKYCLVGPPHANPASSARRLIRNHVLLSSSQSSTRPSPLESAAAGVLCPIHAASDAIDGRSRNMPASISVQPLHCAQNHAGAPLPRSGLQKSAPAASRSSETLRRPRNMATCSAVEPYRPPGASISTVGELRSVFTSGRMPKDEA